MTPKTIQDLYGQELQVDVEMGDGSVWLHWQEDDGPLPARPAQRKTSLSSSSLSPAQARELAEQLIEASKEAEAYGD